MKRLFSIIIALLPCAVAFANQKADTLFVVQRADSVVIVDNETELNVNVVVCDSADQKDYHRFVIPVEPGAERVLTVSRLNNKSAKPKQPTEINVPCRKEGNSRWDPIIGGLYFGVAAAMDAPPGLSRQIEKSWEAGMLYVFGVRYSFSKWCKLNFGLGLNGRSMNIGGGMRYVADGPGVAFVPFPAGAVNANADIYTFSIDVPLLLRQHLPVKLDGRHRMSLVAGGILNFNTYSSVSSHYSLSGNRRFDEKLDHKYHRPVTWQLMGGIFFNDWLGAYVKYMPVEPMKLSAMSYKPLSVGLQVSF